MKKIRAYNGKIVLEFDEVKHQLFVNGVRNFDNVTGATSRIAKDGLVWWSAGEAVKEFGWYNEKKIREKNTTEEAEEIIAKCRGNLAETFCLVQKMTPDDYWEKLQIAYKAHITRKEEAADIGSMVHEFAEHFALGKKPEIPEHPKAKNGVLAFLRWIDEDKIKLSRPEEIVYSRKHGYWGIKDADGSRGKELFVIDYKTSSGIYNEHLFQVSAYLKGAEEMYGRKYTGYWLLHFDKDTGEFTPLFIGKKEAKKNFDAFLAALVIKRREAELKNGR